MESCIFCRIINRTDAVAILAEDADTIVFLSLEGHPLVVPKPHVPDIYTVSDKLGAALMRQTVRIARAVKAGLRADGIYITQANEIAAGQDVFISTSTSIPGGSMMVICLATSISHKI